MRLRDVVGPLRGVDGAVERHGETVVVGLGNVVVVVEWDSGIGTQVVGSDGTSASHTLGNKPLKNEPGVAARLATTPGGGGEAEMGRGGKMRKVQIAGCC